MKKIWLVWTIVGCIACGALYAFNPFKKKDWEKAAEGAGKGLKKAGEGVTDAAKAALGTSAECKEMRALAAQWAAKETEYAITQAAVQRATQAVETAQKLVKAGTDVGKAGADVSSAVLNLGASAIDKGINITRVYLNGRVDGFTKGAFPAFQIKGTAFGKPFDVKMQLNITKPVTMTKLLLQNVF